jgi:hypothetical protein
MSLCSCVTARINLSAAKNLLRKETARESACLQPDRATVARRSGVADDRVQFAQTVKISADAGVTIEASVVTIAIINDELGDFAGFSPSEAATHVVDANSHSYARIVTV